MSSSMQFRNKFEVFVKFSPKFGWQNIAAVPGISYAFFVKYSPVNVAQIYPSETKGGRGQRI